MSDNKPGTNLSAAELEKVGGGLSCSADELNQLIADLKDNYESLIDFTSYLIERVAGNP